MPQVPNISSLFEGKRAAIDPRALQQEQVPARTVVAEDDPRLVRIIGPMYQYGGQGWFGDADGYDLILQRISTALAEPGSEITVYIDSPGGEVSGLESVIDAICAVRDARGKTIHVEAGELLASAGYWLACGICNGNLSAPKSSEIGSIGVLSMFVDESERLKKMGINVKLIRNPDGKAPGTSADPLPDVAMQRERERVDEIASRFFEAVSSARGIAPDVISMWNGATFTASQAKDLGLIDHVMVPHAPTVSTQHNATTPIGEENVTMKKAEETPVEEVVDTGDNGTASAASVGEAASSCAAACEACAAACVDGTVDEAMSAITAMVEACGEATATAAAFFDAIGIKEEEEEVAPEETAKEPAPAHELEARLAKIERRLEAQDRQRVMSKKRLSAEQRAKLTAMDSSEFYAAIEFLPDRYENKLANDITPNATRGGEAVFGLSASDMRACKERNIDPEKLAQIKTGLANRK